jgi:hypothetical protein
MPRDETVRVHLDDEAPEVVIDFSTPRNAKFKSLVHIWLEKFMQRVAAEHTATEQYGRYRKHRPKPQLRRLFVSRISQSAMTRFAASSLVL